MNRKYLLAIGVLVILGGLILYVALPLGGSSATEYTITDNPFGYTHISEFTDARLSGALTNNDEFISVSSENVVQCNTYTFDSSGSTSLQEEDNGLHETGATLPLDYDSDLIITCLVDERLVEEDEDQEYLIAIIEYIPSTDTYNIISSDEPKLS